LASGTGLAGGGGFSGNGRSHSGPR
jgi:hypothetical protein